MTIQNGTLTPTGAGNWATSGTTTVDAVINGIQGIAKSGGGTLTLTNSANSFSGGLSSQNGGSLTFSSIADTGVNSAAGAGSVVTIGINGVLIHNGSSNSSTNRTLTINSSGTANLANNGTGTRLFTGLVSTTNTAARALTIRGTNTGVNEIAGTIADSGTSSISIVKSEAGKWRLSGNNSYTGGTRYQPGRLKLPSLLSGHRNHHH